MLGIVESNLGRSDDCLETDDRSVGVDESCSLLNDGVELRSSNGGGDRPSRVLEDGLDVVRVNMAVGSDEESGDSRDEGSLGVRKRKSEMMSFANFEFSRF